MIMIIIIMSVKCYLCFCVFFRDFTPPFSLSTCCNVGRSRTYEEKFNITTHHTYKHTTKTKGGENKHKQTNKKLKMQKPKMNQNGVVILFFFFFFCLPQHFYIRNRRADLLKKPSFLIVCCEVVMSSHFV